MDKGFVLFWIAVILNVGILTTYGMVIWALFFFGAALVVSLLAPLGGLIFGLASTVYFTAVLFCVRCHFERDLTIRNAQPPRNQG